jgi:hypothetical protein
MDAPPVLSVGDLHLENFGTWRDADGRLVWGVNDFDEAAVMPSVLDLVRLATSIQLAPDLELSNRRAAEALLKGYRAGLDEPQPALLFEGETWLRSYAEPAEGKTEKFWKEIEGFRKSNPPPAVARALVVSLPKGVDKKTVRLCRVPRKGGRCSCKQTRRTRPAQRVDSLRDSWAARSVMAATGRSTRRCMMPSGCPSRTSSRAWIITAPLSPTNVLTLPGRKRALTGTCRVGLGARRMRQKNS